MTDSDEVKLLPCPFCGSEVVEEVGCVGHPIDCDNGCPLLYNAFGVEEWNTRPPVVTDEVVERVAALERALERLEDAAADFRLHPGQPTKATELALAQAAARAILYTPALASMPAVVSGGQSDDRT